MSLNDPAVNAYVNAALRPLCERLRAVIVEIETNLVAFQTGVGPTIAAAVAEDATTVIDDGRAAEGVNQLTVGQVAAIADRLDAVKTLVTAAESVDGMAALNRACVRPLRITNIDGA
jgi:hypothetical protein